VIAIVRFEDMVNGVGERGASGSFNLWEFRTNKEKDDGGRGTSSNQACGIIKHQSDDAKVRGVLEGAIDYQGKSWLSARLIIQITGQRGEVLGSHTPSEDRLPLDGGAQAAGRRGAKKMSGCTSRGTQRGSKKTKLKPRK